MSHARKPVTMIASAKASDPHNCRGQSVPFATLLLFMVCRAGPADHEERGFSLLLFRYPGRRFACPGLLSFAPSVLPVWLVPLASRPQNIQRRTSNYAHWE